MKSAAPTTQPTRRIHPLFYVWSLVLPLMFIAAGIFIPLQWKNDLPATLPTHWGSNGPDAFGTLTEFLVVPSVTFGLVIVFFGILFHVIARDISIQRIGIVANIFVSGLSASITISTAAQARGVTDPTTIDFPAAVVSFSALGSLALGLLLSLSLPRPTYEAAQGLPDVTAPRADLTVHENAAWFIRQFSASSVWFGMGSIPTVAILAFITHAWVALIVVPFLAFALLALFMWDVRVDSSGFSLRSVLGIPKKHIPLAEIESAHVVQVSPFRDFGGWGWRSNLDGTVGVVLRRGDALEIHSSGGRKFLITVDEAEQAAGLLNSLVERSRS